MVYKTRLIYQSNPTTEIPRSSISPGIINTSTTKISTDLNSLHKQVDRYTQRLRKTKNQIRDLEIELNSISPRKRARSELSQSVRKADELSKITNKISESNIILNSYESLMQKYFNKHPVQKIKEDNILPHKKGNYKNLSEIKQIFKKPKIQSRQPSKLTTSRPESSLRPKMINDKPPLPPILTKLDYEKFNQQTKNVLNIINRFFKTTDPQTIKNIIENQREKKRDLQTKQNEAETSLQKYMLKKSKIETAIHNFSPIKVRDMLLITEGKVALSIVTSEKEFIEQILRNFQAQKNALMMSCRYFSDIFELQEVNDFEDLIKIYQIIRQSIKISNLKVRNKVSFTISDLIQSSRINEEISTNKNSVEFDEKVKNIPRLSLASARGNNDFYPGTRSTRRAFNTFNSNSDFREIFSGRGNNDLQFFGKALGNIFVDRYCFEFFKENKNLAKIENNCDMASISPIFVHKVNSYSCKEILRSLADQYLKYHELLYLSVLSDFEISKTEKNFMQFVAIRNFLIKKFNGNYDDELLIGSFDYLVNSNDVAACWFIRDIILRSKPFGSSNDDISQYFEKLVPSFQKRMLALSSVTEITKSTPYIAYCACFSTFLNFDENDDLMKNHILSFINESLIKILNVFVNSMNSPISRCGLVALFQIGKFCPQIFSQCIEFQNKANSDFLVYLRANIQFTTCVKESTEFFNKAFAFISKESTLFHTAMIFHYSLMQLFNPSGINIDVVTSLLSCLITVVANRNKATNEQLTGLGFLQFLMKNFELEAFLASSIKNSNSKIFQVTSQSNEGKKAIINNKVINNGKNNMQFTKLNRIANNSGKNDNESESKADNENNDSNNGKAGVSYLNIPKMNLPHLNLENPKLQLHFKPYSSITRNSLRSSITNNEYIDQRKRKPIYLSKNLHVVYVQLMFALLIDHNVHRLDSFFCDPFPSVNRKPNVLFVLMMHMEGKLNQEIVKPLKDIFNPSFLQKHLESRNTKSKDNTESKSDKPLQQTILNTTESSIQPKGEIQGESSEKIIVNMSFEKVPTFIAQPNFKKTDNISEIINNRQTHSILNEVQQYQDYMRLLRLTVPSCFDKRKYANGYHIASGAFGAVMGVSCDGNELAVKVLEKSRNECDNPHLNEVFTEVSILEICKGDRRVTQLADYGCSCDSYYIVMENYPTTLKAWRRSFAKKAELSCSECVERGEESERHDDENDKTDIPGEKIDLPKGEIEKVSTKQSSDEKDKIDLPKGEIEKVSTKQNLDEKDKIDLSKGENEKVITKQSSDEKDKIDLPKGEIEKVSTKQNLDEKDKIDLSKGEISNDKTDNSDVKDSDEGLSVSDPPDSDNSVSDSKPSSRKDNEEEEEDESVKTASTIESITSPPPPHFWDPSTSPPIPTLLRVYREFLHCATVLTDHRINHFDIKCDNVMLDTTGHPALGDFGESMLYNGEKDCTTLLNRGTEWIKSPEMLSIALDSSTSSPTFDRLRRVGAGPASDVWSIGCLFFELLTGEFLFIDTDWSRFFMRVTGSNSAEDEDVLTDRDVAMLPPDPRFKVFIEFVLKRNVRRRPDIRQVIVKFDEMFPDAREAELPVIERKKQNMQPLSPVSPDSSFSGSPF